MGTCQYRQTDHNKKHDNFAKISQLNGFMNEFNSKTKTEKILSHVCITAHSISSR